MVIKVKVSDVAKDFGKTNKEIIEKTAQMIQDIVKEAEVGKIYTGKVVKKSRHSA